MKLVYTLLLGLALAGLTTFVSAADQFTVQSGDAEIPVARYTAPGKILVLWLPSEYGVLAAEHIAARHLAEKGFETWLPDLYGARFLPVVPSSAETLSAEDVRASIRAAASTGKKIYLVSSGRGAKYLLEGVRLCVPDKAQKKTPAGAVLIHPNLYAMQPEPGEDPAYLPLASETRLDIHILQGELSPWYWTLDSLKTELTRNGGRVGIETFAGIRDRFYFRDSATPAERALGERLPELIASAIIKLQTTPKSKTRSKP